MEGTLQVLPKLYVFDVGFLNLYARMEHPNVAQN
jgi:hypothetical protein